MKIGKQFEIQRKCLEYIRNNTMEREQKEQEIRKEKDINVEISKSAKELIGEINKLEDSPFSPKVEEIRKAIMENKYTISSEQIADKILKAIEDQEGRGTR